MAELDDKVIVTKDKITDVADAIRYKLGESDTYTLDEMPSKVRSIEGGGGSSDVLRVNFTMGEETATEGTYAVTSSYTGTELASMLNNGAVTLLADIDYTPQPNAVDRFVIACEYYVSSNSIIISGGVPITNSQMGVITAFEIHMAIGDTYTGTVKYDTIQLQKILTEGTGISIANDGTISVSFAQAEGGGF